MQQPWNYCGCGGDNSQAGFHAQQGQGFPLPSMVMPPAMPGPQQGLSFASDAPVVYTDNPDRIRYQRTMMPCSQSLSLIKCCGPMVFPPPENECDAYEALRGGGPSGLLETLGWPSVAGAMGNGGGGALAGGQGGGNTGGYGLTGGNMHNIGGGPGCPRVSVVSANGANNGAGIHALPGTSVNPYSGGGTGVGVVGAGGVSGGGGGVAGGGGAGLNLPGPLNQLGNLSNENLCHIIYVFRQ